METIVLISRDGTVGSEGGEARTEGAVAVAWTGMDAAGGATTGHEAHRVAEAVGPTGASEEAAWFPTK